MAEVKAPRRAAPKPIGQALIDNAPWLPVQLNERAAGAMKALARGEATPDAQKFLLNWVLTEVCKVYDMSYRPGGADGERDTAFAEGRRFPGNQMLKHLNINMTVFKRGGNTQ